jgi:hypothetical protein
MVVRKCSQSVLFGHSYAALKGRHLPARLFVKANGTEVLLFRNSNASMLKMFVLLIPENSMYKKLEY